MVKNVMWNLDSLKVSGFDCIPVVVLKNCEPKCSYILADCWKVSSVVPVFKNVGERSPSKSDLPVSEKLLNNRIIDHVEKCGLFLISSMVLGLLNRLQIFWQLFWIELLGLLEL